MQRNHRLKAAREAVPSPLLAGACMSRQELAEAINAWVHTHTGRTGALDAHYIGRLERGAVRWPGREYRAAFRAILGATNDDDLGFHSPTQHRIPPKDKQITTADIAETLTPDTHDRLQAVAQQNHHTDHSALDALANMLTATRHLEDQTSATDVLPAVLNQHQLAENFLRQARRDLQSTVAGLYSEIAQYLGWLYMAVQCWQVSRQYLDQATVLALEAHDSVRLAHALSFQAYRALCISNFRAADALSDAAGNRSSVYPGLLTYMRFQRAEVLAYDGERQAAQRALATADKLLDRLSPTDDLPPGGYWYTPAVLLGHRGFVLRALGEVSAARRAAAESLAEMPETWRNAEWAAQHRQLAEC